MSGNILEMVDSLENDFESRGTEIISAALKIFCNAAQNFVMLTGADAFLTDNLIVNGFPSLSAAKECFGKIPYYAVAESFKRTNLSICEDGFDIIPGCLVKEIFSDNVF